MIIVGIDKASWETRLFISNKIIYFSYVEFFYDLWPYEHDGKKEEERSKNLSVILSNTHYIIRMFRRKNNKVRLKNILFNG